MVKRIAAILLLVTLISLTGVALSATLPTFSQTIVAEGPEPPPSPWPPLV